VESENRKMFLKSLGIKLRINYRHLLIPAILISALLAALFHCAATLTNYEFAALMIAIVLSSVIWAGLIVMVLPPKIACDKVTVCSISSAAAILYHPVLWFYIFYYNQGFSDELLKPFLLVQLILIIICFILIPKWEIVSKYVFAIATAFLADFFVVILMFLSYPGGDL
jgi:hypothetical protein